MWEAVAQQVGRIARIMGQSSLSSVPRDTPLGVLQNPSQPEQNEATGCLMMFEQ